MTDFIFLGSKIAGDGNCSHKIKTLTAWKKSYDKPRQCIKSRDIALSSHRRAIGISRDNWHKRRKTGGKRKPYHKKRKYELGCPAANTKIGPRRIHTVSVRGGNKKYWALRLDVGNFSWGSECCTCKTRIIDVVYNASNNELVRTKTLVKNCIVLINSTPYGQWYKSHCALPPGRKKGTKLTPEEEEILNKKRSKKIQKKYDERKKKAKISSLLGAVPAGQASCMHRFKTRPVWPSRQLHARGKRARVLSEEDQGRERQINPLPSCLSSSNKGIYCSKQNKRQINK